MKKRTSMVTLGITSLFLIFSVLCLVVFSLLSLGTSRSDLSMSQQTMEQTSNYYEACNTATSLCLEIEDFLLTAYKNCDSEEKFYQTLAAFPNETILLHENNRQVSFEIAFSDTQSLLVVLNIFYPQKDQTFSKASNLPDTFMEIDTWKTILTGSWEPDHTQHIFQGE